MSKECSKGNPAVAEPPDGGWGWVVVGAVFISAALTYGASVTYSLFYFPLIQEFHIGLGPVTWLSGAYEFGKAFGYLSTPPLITRFGYRRTSMAASIISGTAISLAAFSPTPVMAYILVGAIPGCAIGIFGTIYYVIITRYFVKRRQLALGLSQTGSAVGTLVLAPVMQLCIESYGWRGTFLLLGGITLNCSIASALYRPILLQSDLEEAAKAKANYCMTLATTAKTVVCIPKFWVSVAIFIVVFSSWRAYLSFLVPFAEHVLKVDPIESSLLLSVYSIVSIFSRMGFGAVGDMKKVNTIWVLVGTQVVTVIISSTVWVVTSYTGLMVNCVAHSLMMGTIHILYVPVLIDIVGEANFKWGMSIAGLLNSVLGSGIVPLIGLFVDWIEDLRWAFVAASILMSVSILLHFPLLKKSPPAGHESASVEVLEAERSTSLHTENN